MHLLAIFGPTAAGKTAVAIAVAELLRKRGEDPVAISCDAIQVYRGLEVLSGAASAAERARLEHRLLGFVDIDEEFSAGRFARLAHEEIDAAIGSGRRRRSVQRPLLMAWGSIPAASSSLLRAIRLRSLGCVAARSRSGSSACRAELPRSRRSASTCARSSGSTGGRNSSSASAARM